MSFNIEFGKLLKYDPEKLETDVVIPDGVEIIGSESFAQCNNLNSVIIPESVVEIKSRAFWGCENLLYIDIPEGVEKIGNEAFGYCYMLERVKLPRTLKSLGRSAFNKCGMLREIIIPDEVTRIEDNTFLNCKRLTHVTLPKSLAEIGECAFESCESLKTIEIPEGVTFIGDNAFSKSGLSRAVIPRSIKTICDDAFPDVDNLITTLPILRWQDYWGISRARYALNFMNAYTPDDPFLESLKEENNQDIKACIYDIGFEYTPDDIKAFWYLINEGLLEFDDIEFFSEKMIDDPEMIAILLDYKNAHFSAEYMEKWEQDKTDKAFGFKEYTFRDLSRNFKIEKNNGGYVIENYRGCSDMVIVPGNINGLPVTTIFSYAFGAMNNVKSVLIEEGVTSIDSAAFCGCPLARIALPDTLRSIGAGAFSECMYLTEITIPSNVTDIGDNAFRSCRSLASVTLPDKITAIQPHSFCNSAICEISIPEGVESIEEYAFAACNNLSKITLPHSLKRIEGFAFMACSSLKRIVLYDNLYYISPDAFADIEKLTIAAPVDSYAMDFALDKEFEFEEIKPNDEE